MDLVNQFPDRESGVNNEDEFQSQGANESSLLGVGQQNEEQKVPEQIQPRNAHFQNGDSYSVGATPTHANRDFSAEFAQRNAQHSAAASVHSHAPSHD